MIPQAKAFHLMFEIQRDIVSDDKKAKEIALKLVKHIIKALRKDLPEIGQGKGYWSEVKKEIEKF
jgi:predicted N-formylglutamate amidohydrolase